MALTTAARVRNRINATDSDISDSELSEFIADEQAYIEECAEKTFAESDAQFGLARSVCTDRCAAKALIHILGLSAGITMISMSLKLTSPLLQQRSFQWQKRSGTKLPRNLNS